MLSDKEIIDNFEVEEIIRKYPPSGQKQVVLVKHKVFGIVILKIVQGQSERVKREIEIVTVNNFDNVPKVLEVNSFNIDNHNGMYLFEEYIDGESLRKILDADFLSLRDAMDLTEHLLRICVQMEDKKIVHRDIKPDNIIRDKNMNRVDGIYFLLLNAMDYDIDLEPQPFTLDEYNQPVGIVSEIVKTGIELPLPA